MSKLSSNLPALALLVSVFVALMGIGKVIWADAQEISNKANREELDAKADKTRVQILEDSLHEIDKALTEIRANQRNMQATQLRILENM